MDLRSFKVQLQIILAIVMSFGATEARAQLVRANLPDAPGPKQDPADTTQPKQETPLKEAIGLLGRRSAFFPELAFDKGPLNSRKKLELAVDETLAPSRALGSLFTSAIGQARDALPGYGQGWAGYGKRFGSSVASNASAHLFGTFLFPSAFHQDPRYFVKQYGSPGSRVLYAIERVVVTRTDDGRAAFNYSGVFGGLMAEGLANSYLPGDERTAGKTFSRYGWRVGFGALDNVIKEFWPTIFRSLRVSKIVPDRGADPGTVTPDEVPPKPPDQ